jgi:hypothetical protein
MKYYLENDGDETPMTLEEIKKLKGNNLHISQDGNVWNDTPERIAIRVVDSHKENAERFDELL